MVLEIRKSEEGDEGAFPVCSPFLLVYAFFRSSLLCSVISRFSIIHNAATTFAPAPADDITITADPHYDKCDMKQMMREMWENGEQLDVCLLSSEGLRVEAHRLVLSLHSVFFRRLFNAQRNAEVRVDAVDGASLVALVSFCYTGRLTINAHTAIDEEICKMTTKGDSKMKMLVGLFWNAWREATGQPKEDTCHEDSEKDTSQHDTGLLAYFEKIDRLITRLLSHISTHNIADMCRALLLCV